MKKVTAIFFTLIIILLFVTSTQAAISNAAFSPTSGYIGDTVTLTINFTTSGSFNALCLYENTAADWDANFPATATSNLGDLYTKNPGTDTCPTVVGFASTIYTGVPGPFGPFGDTLSINVNVPSGATGLMTMPVLQYGTTGTPVSGSLGGFNASFTVLSSPSMVYAASNCGGQPTPCYTSVNSAISTVTSGGTVQVLNAMAAENVTINKDVTLRSGAPGALTGVGSAPLIDVSGAFTVLIEGLTLNGAGGAGDEIIQISDAGANVTVKGTRMDGNGQPAVNNSGGGTLTMYANNVTDYGATALSSVADGSATHNWWGSFTTQPGGVGTNDWATRLGAAVSNFVDGFGSANMGGASLSGGTGTAVIVSHGRGSANAPFGNGITPFVNDMCSDYYDYFVINGSGSWTVQTPVDNSAGCNANTRNFQKVFYTPAANWSTCIADPSDPACWDLVTTSNIASSITLSGQNIIIAGVPSAELGGTPFVAGSSGGFDPTAVSLQTFQSSVANPTTVLVVITILFMGSFTLFAVWKRKN